MPSYSKCKHSTLGGKAMPEPDLAMCGVLRQLMKRALRLLLPAFVLSYKLPYKESYCYEAGK